MHVTSKKSKTPNSLMAISRNHTWSSTPNGVRLVMMENWMTSVRNTIVKSTRIHWILDNKGKFDYKVTKHVRALFIHILLNRCSFILMFSPFFRFEKMISGMYMGEIVRLAIVDLANQNKLFEGRLSEQMKTSGAFGTSYVSDIERYKYYFYR